ncbi:hypothetical protein NA57DRAFT_55278 [Rhizodiscina lignyota]|uniref:Uncharacterized protein n=1 Tax=Rhizodiscina lignyota TaxID=1504668 RepID=A0A9P4ICF2_9PEZI|nr:hypothetical protein NA57DRAFT_55278 [Rhizodiscina lignyota]
MRSALHRRGLTRRAGELCCSPHAVNMNLERAFAIHRKKRAAVLCGAAIQKRSIRWRKWPQQSNVCFERSLNHVPSLDGELVTCLMGKGREQDALLAAHAPPSATLLNFHLIAAQAAQARALSTSWVAFNRIKLRRFMLNLATALTTTAIRRLALALSLAAERGSLHSTGGLEEAPLEMDEMRLCLRCVGTPLFTPGPVSGCRANNFGAGQASRPRGKGNRHSSVIMQTYVSNTTGRTMERPPTGRQITRKTAGGGEVCERHRRLARRPERQDVHLISNSCLRYRPTCLIWAGAAISKVPVTISRCCGSVAALLECGGGGFALKRKVQFPFESR